MYSLAISNCVSFFAICPQVFLFFRKKVRFRNGGKKQKKCAPFFKKN